MTQQQQQPVLSADPRMSALETRVDGLSGTLNGVVAAVNALGEKIDRRSATPWTVIWGALAVLIAFISAVGGLAYYPIKDGQADLKAGLVMTQERTDRRIESLASNQVTRAEHEVHWRSQDRDYDFMRDRIGRVEARLEKRLDQMRAVQERTEDRLVSRAELQGRWEASDRMFGMLRGEVDEHIRAFNERQQHRLDALEDRRPIR